MPNPTYDAIVIGSGLGATVAALRLAQKGKKILILERGT
jgi:cholesterol oxidase